MCRVAVGHILVPGPDPAKSVVRYEALVSQVELLSGGELAAGDVRRLSDRGWGLWIEENETLRFLQSARKLAAETVGVSFPGDGAFLDGALPLGSA